MGDVSDPPPDDPERRGWAPLEPTPTGAGDDGDRPPPPPAAPPPAGGWGPPTTPPGWAPPTTAPGWGPPAGSAGGQGWAAAANPYAIGAPKAGDARTGPLPLHPMSVGDVLDGA